MKKISTILSILIFQCCFLQAQKILFVNKNVQGGLQNGATWANAFPDLQQALAAAAAGDEIWVAAATYFPTATNNPAISFVLKQGVGMYGGFAGTETLRTQRNFESNETILSGNIGSPAGWDNSYHVLYGTGIDSTTILDGFVITRGGNTSATFPHTRGGGLYLEPSPGLYNTCPVIQNCRFEFNFANAGGAIFCSYEFGNIVNPILRKCRFVHNRAATFAGALYKRGPAISDHPFTVEDCIFLKNSAYTSDGGGVYLGTSNTTIFRRCVFEKDSAVLSSGAGIYYGGFSNENRLILDSCIFKENYATEGTGLVFTDFEDTDFYCSIRNCYFEDNKAQNSDGATFFLVSYGTENNKMEVDVQHTVFLNNRTSSNYNIYISTGFNSIFNALFKNCRFINNKDLQTPNSNLFSIGAGIGGGDSQGNISVENCLFADNSGGLALLSAEKSTYVSRITNCTFYRNNKFIIEKAGTLVLTHPERTAATVTSPTAFFGSRAVLPTKCLRIMTLRMSICITIILTIL